MLAQKPVIHICEDPSAVAEKVAQWLLELVESSADRFNLVLSGGGTPKKLYQLMAGDRYRQRFPWGRMHLFWGDERYVPHEHPDSNYQMVRKAMLESIPIPAGNIHPVPTERASPELAAAEYEAALLRQYGAPALRDGQPLFDATLLGIGEDGHTASLFPGTPTLLERSRLVALITGARPEPRITLTFPAIASSGEVAFLACGPAAEKSPFSPADRKRGKSSRTFLTAQTTRRRR